MNKVVLIGRITRDLELRKTQSGTSVVSFTLAVNRRQKSEGQPDADFIRCTAWGKQAEIMAQYLTKGSQVGIDGRIQTGSYQDRNGQTVYTTDVVVENFDFLSSKGSTTAQSSQSYNTGANVGYQPDEPSSNDSDLPNESLDIASDDLPF